MFILSDVRYIFGIVYNVDVLYTITSCCVRKSRNFVHDEIFFWRIMPREVIERKQLARSTTKADGTKKNVGSNIVMVTDECRMCDPCNEFYFIRIIRYVLIVLFKTFCDLRIRSMNFTLIRTTKYVLGMLFKTSWDLQIYVACVCKCE